MNIENDVITNEQATVDLRTVDNKRKRLFVPFDFYGKGVKLGFMAGIGMAVFLFLLSLTSLESSIGAKFFKYLILGGVLTYGLNIQKNYLGKYYQFKKGILFGLFVSVLSAIVLIGINFLAFSFTDTMAFDKFYLSGDKNAINFMVISEMIFLEVFVYGMIITMIILQYLKTRKQPI